MRERGERERERPECYGRRYPAFLTGMSSECRYDAFVGESSYKVRVQLLDSIRYRIGNMHKWRRVRGDRVTTIVKPYSMS